MNAGYTRRGPAWRDWLLRAVAGSPAQLQIMYGLAGERRLTELECRGCPATRAPRRCASATRAARSCSSTSTARSWTRCTRPGWLGLDCRRGRLGSCSRRCSSISRRSGGEPDEGIWEVRGGRQHFTHSKVMAWVAFDRAVKSVEDFGLDGPVERWRAAARRDPRRRLQRRLRRRARQPSSSPTARRQLDASLLLHAARRLPAGDDPRVRGTVAAIERRPAASTASCSATTRRDAVDGLPPGEGAFLACSFWLADAYVLLGRHDEARQLFERLLALRNDVGLLAEEYDPRAERLVGNFPQAFSHVALVNTALNLSRSAGPADQRACRAATGPA